MSSQSRQAAKESFIIIIIIIIHRRLQTPVFPAISSAFCFNLNNNSHNINHHGQYKSFHSTNTPHIRSHPVSASCFLQCSHSPHSFLHIF